jgi:hypothetical protein
MKVDEFVVSMETSLPADLAQQCEDSLSHDSNFIILPLPQFTILLHVP